MCSKCVAATARKDFSFDFPALAVIALFGFSARDFLAGVRLGFFAAARFATFFIWALLAALRAMLAPHAEALGRSLEALEIRLVWRASRADRSGSSRQIAVLRGD